MDLTRIAEHFDKVAEADLCYIEIAENTRQPCVGVLLVAFTLALSHWDWPMFISVARVSLSPRLSS